MRPVDAPPATGGEPVRVFVYGTLRGGGPANGLLAGFRRIGGAVVRGVLHDVGGRYPALVAEGEGVVHGELWEGPGESLPALDAYEGVARGLFRRVRLVADGGECWGYVAGPALAGRLGPASVVAGGRWEGGGG